MNKGYHVTKLGEEKLKEFGVTPNEIEFQTIDPYDDYLDPKLDEIPEECKCPDCGKMLKSRGWTDMDTKIYVVEYSCSCGYSEGGF